MDQEQCVPGMQWQHYAEVQRASRHSRMSPISCLNGTLDRGAVWPEGAEIRSRVLLTPSILL